MHDTDNQAREQMASGARRWGAFHIDLLLYIPLADFATALGRDVPALLAVARIVIPMGLGYFFRLGPGHLLLGMRRDNSPTA